MQLRRAEKFVTILLGTYVWVQNFSVAFEDDATLFGSVAVWDGCSTFRFGCCLSVCLSVCLWRGEERRGEEEERRGEERRREE
jgi:hypothetical protein